MANLIGALTANVYMLLIISVFIARLLRLSEAGRLIGLASSLVIIPLIYLFISGIKTEKTLIYFIWLALMFLFALFELIADDILQIDLRSSLRVVIPYVMFFFAATGGMIGVASQAGKPWPLVTSIIFLIMATLAFIQRKVTGF
jgi:hypothetical protein